MTFRHGPIDEIDPFTKTSITLETAQLVIQRSPGRLHLLKLDGEQDAFRYEVVDDQLTIKEQAQSQAGANFGITVTGGTLNLSNVAFGPGATVRNYSSTSSLGYDTLPSRRVELSIPVGATILAHTISMGSGVVEFANQEAGILDIQARGPGSLTIATSVIGVASLRNQSGIIDVSSSNADVWRVTAHQQTSLQGVHGRVELIEGQSHQLKHNTNPAVPYLS